MMTLKNIKLLTGAALSFAFLAVCGFPANAQMEENQFLNQPWRTNQLPVMGENVRLGEIEDIVGDIMTVQYPNGDIEYLGLSRPQAASIVPGNCVLTAEEEILRVAPCNNFLVDATVQTQRATNLDALLGPVRQPSMILQPQQQVQQPVQVQPQVQQQPVQVQPQTQPQPEMEVQQEEEVRGYW